MKQPVYLAVHVPEFPAQALLRLRPQRTHTPVAVLKGKAPLQQVSSMNTSARQLGVVAGMTVAQLETFPGLEVLCASTAEEASARNALVQAAAAFTPRVEPRQSQGATFTMVLDMTGTQWMLGSVEQAVQGVQQALLALRFTVWLAASSSVHASLCLAAMPQRKPVLVPNGQEAEALSSLPLAVLQPSAELTDTFALWGLRTLGQLAALPVADVVARLGKPGRRLHALACGTEQHLLVPEEPEQACEEQIEFDAPVEALESLLFAVRPMLEQLVLRASSLSYALAGVTARLQLDGGGVHARTIRPALPTMDCAALLKLLHLDLESHLPGAAVIAVTTTAELGDRLPVQGGLFAPQLPESMRLDVTLARIAAMVGDQQVGCARLMDTHSERSFTMEPFRATAQDASGSLALSHENVRVAVRRCRPPVLLRVYTGRKRHAQRPLSFYLHGRLYNVCHCFGPWRLSGDWWSSEVWSHEDWDVHAECKGSAVDKEELLCVLRHNLLQNSWTFEGVYD